MRVYIAGPYSKGDVILNIREAIYAADWLLAGGHVPFVPHLTGFWHAIAPKPYESWLAYDMEWLKVCDAVLRLPGESSGADKEVAEARRLGVPVFESVPELFAAGDGPAR